MGIIYVGVGDLNRAAPICLSWASNLRTWSISNLSWAARGTIICMWQSGALCADRILNQHRQKYGVLQRHSAIVMPPLPARLKLRYLDTLAFFRRQPASISSYKRKPPWSALQSGDGQHQYGRWTSGASRWHHRAGIIAPETEVISEIRQVRGGMSTLCLACRSPYGAVKHECHFRRKLTMMVYFRHCEETIRRWWCRKNGVIDRVGLSNCWRLSALTTIWREAVIFSLRRWAMPHLHHCCYRREYCVYFCIWAVKSKNNQASKSVSWE